MDGQTVWVVPLQGERLADPAGSPVPVTTISPCDAQLQAFTLTAAAPAAATIATKLAFTTQLPASIGTNQQFNVKVAIENAGGTVLPTQTTTVTLAINAGTGTAGATLTTSGPISTVAGVSDGQPILVGILDPGDNVVTSDNSAEVQPSLVSPPAGASLTCTDPATLQAAAVAGIVTFEGCSVNVPGDVHPRGVPHPEQPRAARAAPSGPQRRRRCRRPGWSRQRHRSRRTSFASAASTRSRPFDLIGGHLGKGRHRALLAAPPPGPHLDRPKVSRILGAWLVTLPA